MSDSTSAPPVAAGQPVAPLLAFSTLTRVFATYSISWRKALGVLVLGAVFVGLMGYAARENPPPLMDEVDLEVAEERTQQALASIEPEELANLSEDEVNEQVEREMLRLSSDEPKHDLNFDVAIPLVEVGVGILVPLICLLFAVPALGTPRSDHALSYVWLSGAPLWVVPTAGLTAALLIALPLATLVIVAAAVAAKGTAGVVTGVLVGSIFGSLAWCSIAMLASLMLGRPLIWGLAYVIVVEPFLAGNLAQDTAIGALSISRYLTSPIKSWISVADDGDFAGSAVSPTVAIIVMLAIAVAAVAAATWRLSRMTVDE